MKISIGCDHGGVTLKNAIRDALLADGHDIQDYGVNATDSVDYPDYAQKVSLDVAGKVADFGVLVCTTGIGMSITANKVAGVRAALVHNEEETLLCRSHNNANIICFGEKFTTPYMGVKYSRLFIETAFEGGRHQRRVDKMMACEGSETGCG